MRIYQVDAFATKPFEGNPAAVMPLDHWLPDELLQRIAAENNLSETAFFVGDHLRWFTPTTEVDLCGHATLAAAFVVMTELEPQRTEITFQTKSGPLRVTKGYTLDLPARESVQAPALDLGKPTETWLGEDYLCVYPTEAAVRALQPDFRALAQLGRGVIATARASDFVSRYFAPSHGIDEDPVTGSAHCQLGPLWAKKLGKTHLHAKQVSKRGGEMEVEVKGDRVLLTGSAVLVMRGEFCF